MRAEELEGQRELGRHQDRLRQPANRPARELRAGRQLRRQPEVELAVAATYRLLRSRLGLALTAVRDNEVAARSVGVRVSRARRIVYVVVAAGAGAAGGMLPRGLWSLVSDRLRLRLLPVGYWLEAPREAVGTVFPAAPTEPPATLYANCEAGSVVAGSTPA